MIRIIIRILINAVALWVASLVVSGTIYTDRLFGLTSGCRSLWLGQRLYKANCAIPFVSTDHCHFGPFYLGHQRPHAYVYWLDHGRQHIDRRVLAGFLGRYSSSVLSARS